VISALPSKREESLRREATSSGT